MRLYQFWLLVVSSLSRQGMREELRRCLAVVRRPTADVHPPPDSAAILQCVQTRDSAVMQHLAVLPPARVFAAPAGRIALLALHFSRRQSGHLCQNHSARPVFLPPTYHLAKLSPTRVHTILTAVCGRNNTQPCDILLACAVAPAYLDFLAVSREGVRGERRAGSSNERWHYYCGGGGEQWNEEERGGENRHRGEEVEGCCRVHRLRNPLTQVESRA